MDILYKKAVVSMDILIFIGIFLIIAVSGVIMQKAHEQSEKESRFDTENPLSGMPIISTEPHYINNNRAIKYTESVTGTAIIRQPLKNALQTKWAQFFKSKNAYKKDMRRVSKQAVINMKKSAKHAHLIVNTRVQTSVIKSQNILEPDKVCAVAYGVAITYY